MGIPVTVIQMKGHAIFQGGWIAKWCKYINNLHVLLQEPVGQFQPNFAQIILGVKEI